MWGSPHKCLGFVIGLIWNFWNHFSLLLQQQKKTYSNIYSFFLSLSLSLHSICILMIPFCHSSFYDLKIVQTIAMQIPYIEFISALLGYQTTLCLLQLIKLYHRECYKTACPHFDIFTLLLLIFLCTYLLTAFEYATLENIIGLNKTRFIFKFSII